MTALVVFLLGSGVLLVVNALDGPNISIVKTLQDILQGNPVDVSGQAGQDVNNIAVGTGYGTPVTGTKGEVTANAYPETASEWPVGRFFRGIIAACVQTSGAIVGAMLSKMNDDPAAVASQVNEMIAHGEATYGGYSNIYGEQKELSRHGVKSTIYPVSDTNVAQQTILDALNRGMPIMIGNSEAWHLVDMITGKRWNDQPGHRVHGHGFVVEKANDQGVWAADPNTPDPGRIVFYTWSNLWDSHVNQLLVPT